MLTHKLTDEQTNKRCQKCIKNEWTGDHGNDVDGIGVAGGVLHVLLGVAGDVHIVLVDVVGDVHLVLVGVAGLLVTILTIYYYQSPVGTNSSDCGYVESVDVVGLVDGAVGGGDNAVINPTMQKKNQQWALTVLIVERGNMESVGMMLTMVLLM